MIGEELWARGSGHSVVLFSQVFISQGIFVHIIVSRHFILVILIGNVNSFNKYYVKSTDAKIKRHG